MTIQSTNVVSFNNAQNTSNQVNSIDGNITMTSVEIAEVTGKQHRNVKRDIKAMFEKLNLDVLKFEQTDIFGNNQTRTIYAGLTKQMVLALMANYDVRVGFAMAEHIEKLERELHSPQFQIPQTLSEALMLAGSLAQKNEQLVHKTTELAGEIVDLKHERYTLQRSVNDIPIIRSVAAARAAKKVLQATDAQYSPTQIAQQLRATNFEPRLTGSKRCSAHGLLFALEQVGFVIELPTGGYEVTKKAKLEGYGYSDAYGRTRWHEEVLTEEVLDYMVQYVNR